MTMEKRFAIGMGDSVEPTPSGPDRCTFIEHRRYLDGLLDALAVDRAVTLVVHDHPAAGDMPGAA